MAKKQYIYISIEIDSQNKSVYYNVTLPISNKNNSLANYICDKSIDIIDSL